MYLSTVKLYVYCISRIISMFYGLPKAKFNKQRNVITNLKYINLKT